MRVRTPLRAECVAAKCCEGQKRLTRPPISPVGRIRYPCADGKAARIRASASGASRDANTGLQRAVNEALAESQGGESVLAAAASAAAAAEELAVSLDAAGRDAGAGAGTTPPPAQQSALCRCLIWFHHIKSLQKRKDILAWATELRLGGFSKPGFPGVIIAEGAADDVDEYIGRLRALRWQAMSVREQELVQVAEGGRQRLHLRSLSSKERLN